MTEGTHEVDIKAAEAAPKIPVKSPFLIECVLVLLFFIALRKTWFWPNKQPFC